MFLRCAALSLGLALVSATALADVPDADKAAARALAQQGQDALDRKDFTTAVDRFERARQLFPAPTLAVGLARAQVGVGRLVAAQETLNRVLREGAPAGSPPAYAKAVAEAHRDLDALEPRIPNLIIFVKGPASARVTLDGAPVSNALLGVGRPVDPGRHLVRAEADGFAPVEATVNVAEQKTEPVTLTLDHRVAGPPPPPTPGVAPPPGGAPPPPPPPPSSGPLRKTLGFVGIGVGGAGLVLGAITGGLALSKSTTLSGACTDKQCPSAQQSNVDSYHTLATLSTVGFVAGGVLAAAGVVLVVTAPRPVQGREAWVAPVVGPGYAGLQGRF